MTNLADFRWEILGTSNGQAPTNPMTMGSIKMKLYDSGCSYDALRAAIRKDDRAPKDFARNFLKIADGKDTSWKLWMVEIYADRLVFGYRKDRGDDLYCFTVAATTLLGLRFITRLCVDGHDVNRVITCLVYGDISNGGRRTQVEEFQDDHMVAAFNLYYSEENS